jgi:hypothetical protein
LLQAYVEKFQKDKWKNSWCFLFIFCCHIASCLFCAYDSTMVRQLLEWNILLNLFFTTSWNQG